MHFSYLLIGFNVQPSVRNLSTFNIKSYKTEKKMYVYSENTKHVINQSF